MVTSKVQHPKSAAAAAELLILNVGIKEVMVVKKLDFAHWPFSESAAAKFKNGSNIWFRGLGIIIAASAKYKNAKYENECIHMYVCTFCIQP